MSWYPLKPSELAGLENYDLFIKMMIDVTCDPTLPPIFGRVRPTKETDNEAFTF